MAKLAVNSLIHDSLSLHNFSFLSSKLSQLQALMWKLWGDTTFQLGSIYQIIFLVTCYLDNRVFPFENLVVLELAGAKPTSAVPEDDQGCSCVCKSLDKEKQPSVP